MRNGWLTTILDAVSCIHDDAWATYYDPTTYTYIVWADGAACNDECNHHPNYQSRDITITTIPTNIKGTEHRVGNTRTRKSFTI